MVLYNIKGHGVLLSKIMEAKDCMIPPWFKRVFGPHAVKTSIAKSS